jgi:hypothetical protein
VVMSVHLRHGRQDIYTLTSPTNCQKSLADILQICPSGSQVARSPGCIVLLPMFHDRRQHAVSRTVYLSLNLARSQGPRGIFQVPGVLSSAVHRLPHALMKLSGWAGCPRLFTVPGEACVPAWLAGCHAAAPKAAGGTQLGPWTIQVP